VVNYYLNERQVTRKELFEVLSDEDLADIESYAGGWLSSSLEHAGWWVSGNIKKSLEFDFSFSREVGVGDGVVDSGLFRRSVRIRGK